MSVTKRELANAIINPRDTALDAAAAALAERAELVRRQREDAAAEQADRPRDPQGRYVGENEPTGADADARRARGERFTIRWSGGCGYREWVNERGQVVP